MLERRGEVGKEVEGEVEEEEEEKRAEEEKEWLRMRRKGRE
jgi:hypothetical protein